MGFGLRTSVSSRLVQRRSLQLCIQPETVDRRPQTESLTYGSIVASSMSMTGMSSLIG